MVARLGLVSATEIAVGGLYGVECAVKSGGGCFAAYGPWAFAAKGKQGVAMRAGVRWPRANVRKVE